MNKQNIIKSLLVLTIIAGGAGTLSLIQNVSADEAELEKPMGAPHVFENKVTRSVENIENGVIITLTTEDEESLEHLQNMTEMPTHGPMMDWMEDVDQAINVLDNGVEITLTSEDPEVVEKLQNLPEPGSMGGGPGHMPMPMFFGEDVERSVETIENGIVITLTSEDPEVVEKLQNFKWEPEAPEEE